MRRQRDNSTARHTTGVIGAAAIALCAGGLAGATSSAYADAGGAVVTGGPLVDFAPDTTDPTDGATAQLTMTAHSGSTTFVLRIKGMDPALTGRDFGAHLHLGPCVAGNPTAALAHYNTDVLAGVVPPQIGPTTEVWLDFVVNPAGNATAVATVPFVPAPGNRAIVIHRDPTDSGGVAGPRLACLPLSW